MTSTWIRKVREALFGKPRTVRHRLAPRRRLGCESLESRITPVTGTIDVEAERRRLHKMICMSILTRSPTLGLEDQLLLTFGSG